MSSSYSTTDSLSESFTLTHARQLAAKVSTDLKRFQRFYGSPTDQQIDDYEAELTLLLKHAAVDTVVYGFKRNGLWTMASVKYVSLPGGEMVVDDDPGKIKPNLDVSGASFGSFLSYSSRWFNLTLAERTNISNASPIKRGNASSPDLENGHWAQDLNYSAGGRSLGRSTVRT